MKGKKIKKRQKNSILDLINNLEGTRDWIDMFRNQIADIERKREKEKKGKEKNYTGRDVHLL